MTTHQQSLHEAQEACKVAELFLIKYEAKLPEGLGSFYVGSAGARFEVHLGHRNESDRQKALAYLGDAFGRGGWDATLGYGGNAFDWTKEVEGVRIKIESAQPTGTPKSFPVDPKQFPMQIQDTAEATYPEMKVEEVAQ